MNIVNHESGVRCIVGDCYDTLLMSACACRLTEASQTLSNASSDIGELIILAPGAPVAAGIDHSGDRGRLQPSEAAEQPCQGTWGITNTEGPLRIPGTT